MLTQYMQIPYYGMLILINLLMEILEYLRKVEFFIKQEDPLSFFAHRIYGHYSPEGYNKISKNMLTKYFL